MKKLTPITHLLRNSFEIYFQKQNFFYLIKVFLFGILKIALFIVPSLIVWAISSLNLPENLVVLTNLTAVILFVLGVVFGGAWLGASFILSVVKVVEKQTLGVKETFKNSRLVLWKFLRTSILVTVVTILGYLLLVIPGMIFQVWFGFAVFITLIEGSGAIDSIKKSKELVKGYFWPVAGRFFVFMLLSLLAQTISSVRYLETVGSIASFLLTPYFMLLPYLLYKDLRQVRGL